MKPLNGLWKMTPQQRTEIERAIKHLQDALNSDTPLISLLIARDQKISPVISELIKAL